MPATGPAPKADAGATDLTPPPAPAPNGDCADDLTDRVGCPCPGEGATRTCYSGPTGTTNLGACHDGTQACMMVGEFLVWGDCGGAVKPTAEDCSNDTDTNCNGLVGCADPACAGKAGCCAPGEKRDCYNGAPGTSGVGICVGGTQTCDANGAWLACQDEVIPGSEAGKCDDGLDNDCNGKIDCDDPVCNNDIACKPPVCTAGDKQDCYTGPTGTLGIGQCAGGKLTCAADGQSWGTSCDGQVVPGSEAGKCGDGIDNDCNGIVDCKDPACNGDPACACVPGTSRACYTGPAGTEDIGECHGGTQVCNSVGSAWGPCVGQVLPAVEAGACDDWADNDCNGLIDCEDAACKFETYCCESTVTYDATIYATSATSMYVVNPSDWSVTAVGTYGTTDRMTDIGMTPDGELYTLSSTAFYRINKTTGVATKVVNLTGALNNSLTFLADNRLLAADASGMLKVVNPATASITNIGLFGNNYGSSGDIVAVGDGTMFGVSATSSTGANISSNNLLITINTSTGAATPVGSTGFKDVFGMAYYKSRVIGFTGSGQIIEINPTTGAGTLLRKHSLQFFGGTTSPLIPINGCE